MARRRIEAANKPFVGRSRGAAMVHASGGRQMWQAYSGDGESEAMHSSIVTKGGWPCRTTGKF